ncbi:MAG: hypothetical protein A3J63_04145 [Candidatus Moranbacteria bacterium RIFCSPHIGHO2_02_FULL_40_12b]|nr:MAG: hypothetical protein A3J63_04145 [Candidatus Moranbacteria bacterium RIFCSPHIGHO2_02_FULL_40_12b]OGI24294.1 MAG: hypothetical protein A3E91_01065 [Candidatus Moranbacteria bacterium RIFCSPHIGHO2_12_FULL_40_10]
MDQAQIQKALSDELGISNLPQDKQEDLIIRMTELLLKRIFIETMDKLDEEGRDEYEKLTEGGAGPRQIEEFLKSRISDYEEMVQKIIVNFKEEMKNNI